MPTAPEEIFDPAILADTSPEAVEMQLVLTELLPQVLDKDYSTRLTELPAYQTVRTQDVAYQSRLVLALVVAINRVGHRQGDYRIRWGLAEVLTALMRTTLSLTEADYLRLFASYGLDFANAKPDAVISVHFYPFPVLLTLNQVEKLAKRQPLSELMLTFLGQLRDLTAGQTGDALKVHLKTQEILGRSGSGDTLPVVVFATGDPFGRTLTEFVRGLDRADSRTASWLRLLQLWSKATTAQPNAKLRQELATATTAVGREAVLEQGRAWLQLLAEMPVREESQTYGSGSTYTYYTYLVDAIVPVAKGLIWTLQPLADATLLQQLTTLAAKCYRKIPGKGPLAAGLGNACLLALSQNGLPGVAALARVRSKIRQTNTQELIARYIAEESQKLGVTPAEIEDMAVPDFGLENGRLEETFGEYTATLILTDGKAEVQWQKAGKALKSAPAALKASHADELKELKNAQTQAQQTYAAQRDRLDRSFVDERRIPWPWFEQYYFQHGLMSLLAHSLIWRLHQPDGSHHDALWLDEQWRDAHGQPVPTPTDETQVQLWHPVLVSTEKVLAWRQLLETHQLRQPLKQAFREVYLLTPPEERTRTYSNRMAAHILKQHQFNSLAKLRGWRYSLLGAYDKGYESEIASLALPSHNLQAEYWVSEVYADGEWNDTGIYNYVSTDQVRFTRNNEAVPLPEIPPLAFSEVMRDVDLFVGVASVGNDAQWRDNGGLVQYRNYWESYSFGDLSEVAKSRKLVLERLVPRLKIGRVSEIKGNFLVVRGKRHTYKIHLGSGNILMEPNDQYLCIVPDRSSKNLGTHDVFLPFEGDAVLSIILSKALLLMDDDKITDETILRQL